MAFGWKTQYEKRILSEGLTNWEIFTIAVQACKDLNWEHLVVDEKTFTATTPTHWTLAEEIITIVIDVDEIIFKSQSESLDLYEAGRNKKNIEDHLLPAFKKIKTLWSPERLQAATSILKSEVSNQLKTGNRVAAEKISFGFRDHEMTFFLISVKLAIFALMAVRGVNVLHPSPVEITQWGGNVREYVAVGEWWRLITNLFVHIGIYQLITNLFGLYFIGLLVETILGKLKYLIAFFVTGALASLSSIYFAGEGVSAGSSGAVAGLYGVFIAFATTRYINKRFSWLLLSGMILAGLLFIYAAVNGQVDYATNLGGLAAGLLVGYLFYFFHFKRNLARAGGSRISVEVMLLAALLIFLYIKNGKNDSLRFEKSVMKLNQIELRAMTQMQRLQFAESDNDAARVLRDSALPEWRHFQLELAKTDKYRLDEKFNRKRKLLHDYAGLRLRQTELIYKAANEETDKYSGEINEVSDKIDKIIDQLGD
jgi:rhomboid protease GluP